MQISEKQLYAFRAVCNAIVPSLSAEKDDLGYWNRTASDFQVAEKIIQVVATLSADEQRDFIKLLTLLSLPVLGLTWGGPLKSADNLTPQQLEKMLQRWSHSLVPDLREAFGKIKKLCGLYYFGYSSAQETNPNWAALGYAGPMTGERLTTKHNVTIKNVTNNQILDCDVVVVGSGAGGGLIAAELAMAGQKVVVVEKGAHFEEQDFTQREVEMMQALYEHKALITSKDGGTMFLAGSCLGGGTTVNWAGSLRTPDYVLEEWASEHGNPHFVTDEYKKGFDVVEKRLNINKNISHNLQNKKLILGAQQLGYKIEEIPQNLFNAGKAKEEDYWVAQGYSCFGDIHGSKQSSLKTHLEDACRHGAEILVRTEVEHILIANGVAVGVEATFTDKKNKKYTVTINAKKVVVAAGALHTPALLLRSGLKHKEIGNHLFIHPSVPLAATYAEKIEAWRGPMMTNVCEEFSQLTGNHGFKLETPPVHAGLMAVATSWESGEKYKKEMLDAAYFGAWVVLVRDKFGGSVKLNTDKRPEIHYKLHAFDKKHLIRGMQEAIKVHRAAGATRISVPHNTAYGYDMQNSQGIDFERFLQKMAHLKWETNYYTLYTAHQMGTARMGGNPKKHPVQPTGETWEVKNLFVGDGSLFPSASGVNPMLSIQALAHFVAQNIKASL